MDYAQLNGNALAFIGDAIYSLMVRKYFIDQGLSNCNTLQKRTIDYVSAKGQAKALHYLLENSLLSETEETVVMRGRNAKSVSSAKNVDIITYRKASGFEALFGYLYLMEHYDRLKELFEIIVSEV